jgi:hypothetical protein
MPLTRSVELAHAKKQKRKNYEKTNKKKIQRKTKERKSSKETKDKESYLLFIERIFFLHLSQMLELFEQETQKQLCVIQDQIG